MTIKACNSHCNAKIIKKARLALKKYSASEEYISGHLSKPLVLVGMMGAGKSHIGQELAGILGLNFYDSDKLIEDKAGQSISDIFENFGEAKFRSAEHNTIMELLEQGGRCIIATGGGALTNAKTLEALKKRSVMVWLDADFATLWDRVQKSQTRPLLQTEMPEKKLKNLMQDRVPLYAQAHIRLNISELNQQKTAESLINALYEYLNKDSVCS